MGSAGDLLYEHHDVNEHQRGMPAFGSTGGLKVCAS
jgi:hypothetical protein